MLKRSAEEINNENEKKTRTRRRANSEGTISQRKDGFWVGTVTLGFDKNGKQLRKSVVRKTRGEVAELIKTMLADQQKGQLIANNKILTLETFLTDWLNTYKKISLKPTTYSNYSNIIKYYITPEIGHNKLQKLSMPVVQHWINSLVEKKLSARTISDAINVLKMACNHAIKQKLLQDNPCDDVSKPQKNKPKINPLPIEQIKAFKKECEDYYLGPAFILLLSTGCRRSEVLGLDYKYLNLKDGYISIRQALTVTSNGKVNIDTPKTPSSLRDIPLTDECKEVLMKHKGNKTEGLIFQTSTGKHVHPRNFSRSFKLLLQRAGLNDDKYTIHSLRHTFCTNLLNNSVSVKVVSDLLGHTDTRFTSSVYAHSNMADKKSAMEKMNEILKSV